MLSAKEMFERRRMRNRKRLKMKANGQLRLSVHRTSRHIYAQIIDDTKGETLVCASTLDVDFRQSGKTGADRDAAAEIGRVVGARALTKGIKAVVFDRSGFMFHGRVKAVADAAREAGLEF